MWVYELASLNFICRMWCIWFFATFSSAPKPEILFPQSSWTLFIAYTTTGKKTKNYTFICILKWMAYTCTHPNKHASSFGNIQKRCSELLLPKKNVPHFPKRERQRGKDTLYASWKCRIGLTICHSDKLPTHIHIQSALTSPREMYANICTTMMLLQNCGFFGIYTHTELASLRLSSRIRAVLLWTLFGFWWVYIYKYIPTCMLGGHHDFTRKIRTYQRTTI